jgi:hypothetical protein
MMSSTDLAHGAENFYLTDIRRDEAEERILPTLFPKESSNY